MELVKLGYCALAKKAQICLQQDSCLDYSLRDGKRLLSEAQKETVFHIPPPTNQTQVREFLGTAGFYRLWIPGFTEIVPPLASAHQE